jgi:hypothetical protein
MSNGLVCFSVSRKMMTSFLDVFGTFSPIISVETVAQGFTSVLGEWQTVITLIGCHTVNRFFSILKRSLTIASLGTSDDQPKSRSEHGSNVAARTGKGVWQTL